MKTMLQKLRDCVQCDSIGHKKNGNYVFRDSYYYRHNRDELDFMKSVKHRLMAAGIKNFEIVAYGDHWAAFRGNASVAEGSHFYVEVKFYEDTRIAADQHGRNDNQPQQTHDA